MNWLDIVLAVLLLWAAYRGFSKGLLISVAVLMALFLGILMGIRFSDFAAGHLKRWWDMDETWIHLTAFALIFLAVVIGVHFFARMLERVVRFTGLGWANKMAGSLFGLLKMGLILSLILMFLQSIKWSADLLNDKLKKDSVLAGPVSSIAPFLLPRIDASRISDMIHWEDSRPPN